MLIGTQEVAGALGVFVQSAQTGCRAIGQSMIYQFSSPPADGEYR